MKDHALCWLPFVGSLSWSRALPAKSFTVVITTASYVRLEERRRWKGAWEEGREMTVEEAIEYVRTKDGDEEANPP